MGYLFELMFPKRCTRGFVSFPRQVTSSFCSTEMSEIVIVMVMMTLSWQGQNGSLIKIQLHVLKYLLYVSKN